MITQGHLARRLAALWCAVLMAWCLAPPALAVTAGDETVQVISIDDSDRLLEAVVSVAADGDEPLPASAFDVTVAGRSVPVDVMPAEPAGVGVALLLDAGPRARAETIAALQDSAETLVSDLPEGAETALAVGGRPDPLVQPMTAESDATLEALADEPLTGPGAPEQALEAALDQLGSQPQGSPLVLFTTGYVATLGDAPQPLVDAVTSGAVRLHVISVGFNVPWSDLRDLSDASGGRSLRVDEASLPAAAAAIAAEIAAGVDHRYRVAFDFGAADGPATLTVEAEDVIGAAELPFEAIPASDGEEAAEEEAAGELAEEAAPGVLQRLAAVPLWALVAAAVVFCATCFVALIARLSADREADAESDIVDLRDERAHTADQDARRRGSKTRT